MKVPSGFEPEPGSSRCGNSFASQITVTGELPGKGGFGADKTRLIPRIGTVPSGTWWSNKGQPETDFVQLIVNARNSLESDLIAAATADALSTAQENSVIYLIRLADANLRRVQEIYAYWDGEGPHPETGVGLPYDQEYGVTSDWPLEEGDDIFSHVPECAGQEGKWVEQQALGIAGVQVVRNYYCPTAAMKAERADDRVAIKNLILNAARAVRCGQWGLWRMRLYNEALTEWEEKYGGIGFKLPPAPPPPPTPTPGLLPDDLGLTAIPRPPEPPPPPGDPGLPPFQPPDWVPPDPDQLPSPDAIPDPDPGPVVEPDQPPAVAPPRAPRIRPIHWIVAGAGTLLATGVAAVLLRR